MIETPSILVDQYEFIRLLGEGANGKTWLARKRDTLENVAIKALKISKIENLKSYELFMREAEVLKSVDLLGVPRFYDCVFENDGACYLIQQFIEYPSLQKWIDAQGELNEAMTLNVMLEIANILVGLHTQYNPPIIHRDIKPSNILCELGLTSDAVKHLVLIDFGAVANPQTKTSGSTVAGTFGYMSPEQLLGDVTPQSDFYALGATALHMLVGIPPYKLPTNVFSIKLEAILDECAPQTTPQMRALLASLLAPALEQRPKNARQLRDMIRNVRLHRMPNDDAGGSVCDNYLQQIQAQETDTSGRMIHTGAMARWHLTHGLIRGFSAPLEGRLSQQTCAEYTFDVRERTWCGICPVPDSVKLDIRSLPADCLVQYDPADARYNRVIEIQGMPISQKEIQSKDQPS